MTTTFQRVPQNGNGGIDLLLMIDNSSSMADKQATLADAIPQLLTQLVRPVCVDTQGKPVLDSNGHVTRIVLGTGVCPNGGVPDFKPVNDIHVGIVTSSLGDHGGGRLCTPGEGTSFVQDNGTQLSLPPDVNDAAHLMGTLARYPGAANGTANVTVDPLGFLAWGNTTKPQMTDADLASATGVMAEMVQSADEMGCGLESQLEAWFRFLIDPVPPIYPIQKDTTQQSHRVGSDDALLAQRAAFLRPDSLVVIIMLTDENDCSLRDTDIGWVATDTSTSIKSGSDACKTDPNSNCCYSCTAGGPPKGCPDSCAGKGAADDDGPFQANLRCFHQKRRFGYEFMYPTSRYVVGLTKRQLCPDQTFGDMDCDCTYAKSIGALCTPGTRVMPNPLYSTVIGTNNSGAPVNSLSASSIARADNSAVFLAGIIGVPWQDIAYFDASGTVGYIPVTDPAWTGRPSASGPAPLTPAPANGGIWANIYGDDDSNIVPQDTHMVESLVPRPGISTGDPINGGEWNTAYNDLEYACIYPLTDPAPCSCDQGSSSYSCCKYLHPNDCCDLTYEMDARGGPAGTFNKPLCQGRSQVYAKAYPGLREIAVLRDYAMNAAFPGNSIVASICPADIRSDSDKTGPGYGYNPAVAALFDQLQYTLKASCLAHPIAVDLSTGTVSCNLVEVVNADALNGSTCSDFCTTHQRATVGPVMTADVTIAMQLNGICDQPGTPRCGSMCRCLLKQERPDTNSTGSAAGSDLAVCQNALDGTEDQLPPGYCYVDPSAGVGTNLNLVAWCPDSQRRILRYVGTDAFAPVGNSVPLRGSAVFASCSAASSP